MGKNTIKTSEGDLLSFFPVLLSTKEKTMLPLRQNKEVNAFIHMGKRHIIKRTMKGGAHFMDVFTIDKADQHEMSKSKANILFDFLNLKAYQDYYNSPRIAFTLQEYAEFVGRKPTQSLKHSIIEAIECLEDVCIRLSPIKAKDKVDHMQIPMMTRFHVVEGGKFLVEFYKPFFEHLALSPIMNVHCGIYTADQRKFKYISLMGRYIEEQHRINEKNKRRNNDGLILTIKSLWEADPDAPTYDELSSNGRHYKQQITEPFEKHMKELAHVIGFVWFYCDKQGKASLTNNTYQDGRVKIQFNKPAPDIQKSDF